MAALALVAAALWWTAESEPEPPAPHDGGTAPDLAAEAQRRAVVFEDQFEGEDGVIGTARGLFRASATSADEPNLSGQDPHWVVESGEVERLDGAASTDSDFMRMWTRAAYPSPRVDVDVQFDGWREGSRGWHGVNVWLNYTLCTPTPHCSLIDDEPGAGPSGYALDFANRDGGLTIQKKTAGDTRDRWEEGARSFSNGGTYYNLVEDEWSPVPGGNYTLSAEALQLADGSVLLTVTVDGQELLRVVDDGEVGGPPLTRGRVGLRSDFAQVSFDDLRVLR